jgi:hypothetical protein
MGNGEFGRRNEAKRRWEAESSKLKAKEVGGAF